MKAVTIFPVLIMAAFPHISSAQETVAEASTADTSSNGGRNQGIHSLYAGTGYGSNMVYLGSTISQDKPYGYASLTYGIGDKFYLSGSAVHLTGTIPYVAFYTASASFSHTFNSWLDISAGLSRYQVHKSLTDTLFESFTYGEISLGIDWKVLYTKLSAGRIFSTESSSYYQIRNSRYFQTPEFGSGKFYFSFDPYVNLILGTLTKTETSNSSSIVFTPPFRKRGMNQQTSGSTTYKSIFGILEADFGIPVAFNSSRLTIEAEPGYIYPLYEESAYPGTKGFLFLLSAYLRIF
ncbi:MAG TPA: hypothetical protein P5320_11505 [Bacteroidales bacterium]|nr:hypothetical protein [Bacteroidales bacterium]HOK76036.1 hypothetical protein [Bacteroidales bacterium]HOM41674.1 hypothetical protein [Bacteroidales bacterium]HRR17340.1 hypothetical protein [Bacteroidales bacterium]HRU57856.1 hypothetical protein [Bacteroidales bacterium]